MGQLRLGLAVLFVVLLAAWIVAGLTADRLEATFTGGEGNIAHRYAVELETRSYANPGGPIAQTPGATELTLRYFLGRPVYRVVGLDGMALFDAQSGAKLSPLNEAMARETAQRDFVGSSAIESATLLTAPPAEYAGQTPVWRVTFADDLKTRLYISPGAGEVVARRNRHWDAYRFFRRLHLAGAGRPAYEDPLLDCIVLVGFLFVASGVVGRFRAPGEKVESDFSQNRRDH